MRRIEELCCQNLVKVDKNTVCRLTATAGDHARRVHDDLMPVSPLNAGDPVRREVGVRLQEAEALRRQQSVG